MKYGILAFAIAVLLAAYSLWTGELSAPIRASASSAVFFGRRLEPPAGVILHGAGQDDTTFRNYTLLMAAQRPMLSMSYVDLKDDLPSFFAGLTHSLDRYPDLIVPQIGLSLNQGDASQHYEQLVADGTLDKLGDRLTALCAGLEQLDRPVFLRIGYEFNGQWNGYSPRAYVGAFRRVAARVHACSAATAIVWDFAPDAYIKDYMRFYPGDASVDWWAINLFSDEDFNSSATRSFMQDALKHRFPVMIAEATSRRVPVTDPAAVALWFQPFFDFLRSYPQVKAFCYIDWDWRRYPQWADWGDARIEDNAQVEAFYLQQIGTGRYQSATNRQWTIHLLRPPGLEVAH